MIKLNKTDGDQTPEVATTITFNVEDGVRERECSVEHAPHPNRKSMSVHKPGVESPGRLRSLSYGDSGSSHSRKSILGSVFTSDVWDERGRKVERRLLLPTYRLRPKRSEKFNSCSVRNVIRSNFEAALPGVSYNSTRCANLAKDLSEMIKADVKTLGFCPRYKYVCVVTIGPLGTRPSLLAGSGTLWDASQDNFGTYTWKGGALFAVGVVYGCYRE